MKSRKVRLLVFLLCLALINSLCMTDLLITSALGAGVSMRVSTSSTGTEGNGASYDVSISPDGRYVAFESTASNLVDGDTNAISDVFVKDTQTNQTTRLSTSSTGTEGNSGSYDMSISSNGRYVAFESNATNLVDGDTNAKEDVFVKDTQANQTTRLSTSSTGTEGNDDCYDPSMSANGRYVAFESNATNLVGGDTNAVRDVFVKDIQTNQTTRISTSSTGTEGNSGSYDMSISSNGRYVAFESDASNLVDGDTNAKSDIFIKDTQTNQTTRVSTSSAGTEGNNDSADPSISSSGRYVAFQSTAANLVDGDTNAKEDVFIKDTQTNQTTRISTSSAGTEGNNDSYDMSISSNGRYVAFESNATNLVDGDTNAKEDIFVKDTQTNQTTRLSTSSTGTEGNDNSYDPDISSSGRYVAFESLASNLVDGDTNAASDSFLAGNDLYKAGSSTWYFAEGYTGSGFEEWLTLQNPNSSIATATITYMYRGGAAPTTRNITIPGNSRETVDVNGDVGSGKEVSIKVDSNQPLVAERPMYFNYQNKWQGGHNTIGTTSPSSTWYFAEGYTGSGFEEWLTLQNPNSSAATATITYMYRGGAAPTTKNITIAANSRETIDVNGDVGSNKEVSIKVDSNQPLVAERPIYFNYQNQVNGGHNTIGATETTSSWYFAEGYTGSGFENWLTLQNPNSSAATATITYMYRGGAAPTTRDITIAANSRETVDVNADVGSNKEVSIKVDSNRSIVAERPMYFDYQNKWGGGDNTVGVTNLVNQWFFAEGYTGSGFEEWLTLQNPNSSAATATITYMFRGGAASTTRDITIAANSRETVDVNADVGSGKEVSIKVDSNLSIVAERPMYFNYQNKWQGGHNTIGYGP